MKMVYRTVCLALGLMIMCSCGGGGGGTGSDGGVLAAGKVTLSFSAAGKTQLDTAISGIDLSVVLPQGITVATTNGTTGQIDSSAITSVPALTGTNLAFGTYTASNGEARLSMATTSANYRSGEFLRLTCTVAPNSNITLAGIQALNTPVIVQKAVGYDPATKSTVDLTGKVSVTIAVGS